MKVLAALQGTWNGRALRCAARLGEGHGGARTGKSRHGVAVLGKEHGMVRLCMAVRGLARRGTDRTGKEPGWDWLGLARIG